jgi:trimeric autotransporter adhesin
LSSGNGGYSNVAIGSSALPFLTTGYRNVGIGQGAGNNVTYGSNLVCIGFGSAASTPTSANEITLGNADITVLRCAVTSITALSDLRDKADVKLFDGGLRVINSIPVKTYRWDKREWYEDGKKDGSKKQEKLNLGFIAQDLEAVQEELGVQYLNLVYKSNPEKLEATPGNLLPVAIRAIQELSNKIESLGERIKRLEETV